MKIRSSVAPAMSVPSTSKIAAIRWLFISYIVFRAPRKNLNPSIITGTPRATQKTAVETARPTAPARTTFINTPAWPAMIASHSGRFASVSHNPSAKNAAPLTAP